MGASNQYKDLLSHGEMERTKRLINAAVRLWELRRESPQYSGTQSNQPDNEHQSNRVTSSAPPGSPRSTSIAGLASHSRFGAKTQGEPAGERSETNTGLAERLVTEALAQLRWRETDLLLHPKGHQSKIQIARQLREQTPMTYQWIAHRLHMGTRSYVFNLLAQSK